MTYFYIKALHIVFIITWFAGLFYIVRLFIYHTEAFEKGEPEKSILLNQYTLMSSRLWYGITWPSAIITLVLGLTLVHLLPYAIPDWLWIKFGFLAGLYAYHLICHSIFLSLQKGRKKWSSTQLRIWNEVATVFLVAIVFLAILKNTLSLIWGLAGLFIFSAALMGGIIVYKKLRKKQEFNKK
jgi:protoporphyrinogen IX oxidase